MDQTLLTPLLPGVAPSVVQALAEVLRAEPAVSGWSEGARRFLRAGTMFATVSTSSQDAGAFAAEVDTRRALPQDGVLRAPAVLASGPCWYVARAVDPRPVEQVPPALVVAALDRLSRLVLPSRRASHPPLRARARQQLRLLGSPVPLADLRRARAVSRSAPAVVTAHNDLHVGNVLATSEALHVIDWEHAGKGPAGADLARLCALLDPAYADRLVSAAVEAGLAEERQLRRLRYAAVVRAAADLCLADPDQGRDPGRAAGLVAELPRLREEAGL